MSSHTYRRCTDKSSKMEISSIDRGSIQHEDGSVEAPVTVVDEILGNPFILPDKVHGSINKRGLSESVLQRLQDHSIRTLERFDKGVRETVYRVPVVGHRVYLAPRVDEERSCAWEEKKIKLNPSQYMFHEGRYYSIDRIYANNARNGHLLTGVAPLHPSPLQQHLLDAGLTPLCAEYSDRHSCHKCHLHKTHKAPNLHNGAAQGWQGAGDFLEIYLGRPTYVTHIGTTGSLPKLGMYSPRPPGGPTRHHENRHRARLGNKLDSRDRWSKFS
ncbi:hypothetical protein B484DRAFT_398481 [Ochromonadaceae sp. CCMP2298]|nr:hypothetical protein B484DRAFT_398481 [Ochromonadaceae sp. CCMP2298]